MADNSHIELYEEEEREMNYSTPCSSRSVSPHPGTSCNGLSQEPIFTSNRKEEMETDNVSTAASRFGLRSATELVGDKEPRPALKPSPVATLASASGAGGSRDRITTHVCFRCSTDDVMRINFRFCFWSWVPPRGGVASFY